DLIIFLGASFNERTSYVWNKDLLHNKNIIQIDKDDSQLEKVFKADIAINADIKEALSGVLSIIKSKHPDIKNKKSTRPDINYLKQETIESDSSIFQTRFQLIEKFFAALEHSFPDNAVIFDDNIIFAQNFFSVSTRNRYHPNSGVSSLGHAIPAAIGARFSENKPTFAILGDGGFQMCCMEIMTAVNYNIPLNIVLFNNATMGLIRKNQFQQYNERFISCDFINPDFQALAKSFGIHYIKIEKESDLDTLFTSIDCYNNINLIEIPIDKNAFPNYISKR
ncbi:MAG TPA: thiamine pyrophosphate-dependent enzyme, partial [Gammaproteobacteria bacterium]